MRFMPLTASQTAEDVLASEYKVAREIGKIRLGELHFYFKKGLNVYYIPYRDIRRCFRRVMVVPAKLCCGKGNIEMENLVICGPEDKELAQIQLPGTKAAKILVEELRRLVPEAEIGSPAKS